MSFKPTPAVPPSVPNALRIDEVLQRSSPLALAPEKAMGGGLRLASDIREAAGDALSSTVEPDPPPDAPPPAGSRPSLKRIK